MNKYKIEEILSNIQFQVYSDMNFIEPLGLDKETWKEILEYINKQKELLDKIKEKGVMYYDPEYSKIYGELCSMPGTNNTRTPVIVIDDEILELLEEIE